MLPRREATVTTAPAGLRVRVFWVDATTPNATEVALDPANLADAALWPSAAGRYRIRAVVYDPGYTASTVGELRIVRDQVIDLDARRCGFGSNIALLGTLLVAALASLRLRRRAAFALIASVCAMGQGIAAEPEAAPAPTPAPVAETAPTTPPIVVTSTAIAAPAAFRYGGKFEALPAPLAADGASGPVPAGWWWLASVTRLPDIRLAGGDGEKVDDSRLTGSDWATPWGVTVAARTALPWGGDAEQHAYAGLGLGLRYLHGDEIWQTADRSRSYAFTDRLLTVPVSAQLGWEQKFARNLWLDLGVSGEVGPAIGSVDGDIVLPNARHGATTTAYGITAGWALNAAVWWRWDADRQGLGLLGAWGNTRTSFSYRVEESLDGIDRTKTFDRRLDAEGFSVGVGYRWVP